MKKDCNQKGLMFVDINIAGQRRSTLVNTRALDMFMLKKSVGKLGLLVSKPTKNINTINSKEVSIVRVAQGIELQIGDLPQFIVAN